MSSTAGIATNADDVLRQLAASGEGRDTIEAPVRAFLESGDTTPLLSWLRERGEAIARSGGAAENAIGEAISIGAALNGEASNGGASPGHSAVRMLDATFVTAAVEGYLSGKGAAAQAQASASDEQLRDRVAELTALHRVISAANSSLNLSDMLSETAQAVVDVTRADICSIFLYEPEWDQMVLTATSGLNPDAVGSVRLRLGEGITGWAALAGKPVAVRDAWADPRFKYVPALQEEKAVSILAVPVVLFTDEKLVGVITIHTFDERDFSGEEIKFLETVAGEIAIAIENARLYEQTDAQLRQKVEELSTLQGVSAHIAATLNLSEVLALVAHQAAHLMHADAAAIYELHPDAAVLEQVAEYDLRHPTHSIHQTKAAQRIILNVQDSAIAQVIMRGIPVALPPDADALLGLPAASAGYGSLFCVPLVAPRGIRGGICLYSKEPRIFSEEQVRLLDSFAHEAAIALENSRLYDAALRGLQTKSTMLQEMNHRVRNNLQTVGGLLSMQLRRIPPDSEAATAVRESIARIQSMAAVHDLMMRGDVEVESTSLYELARKVAEAAISTLSKPELSLTMTVEPVDAERIRIGSHEATLLALLFNELISNAILHGFAGRDQGEIRVTALLQGASSAEQPAPTGLGPSMDVQYPGRGIVTIEVADDGVGLPKRFDLEEDANLGLQIVRTLVVSDLRGDFKIERGPRRKGTVASFSFRPSRIA